MKNYAKVGKREGKPAYRTPSSFRVRQAIKAVNAKSSRRFNRGLNH
jgi:hypothetical protein